MSQVKVTLKPKGVAIIAIFISVLVYLALRPRSEAQPVGAAPAAVSAKAAASTTSTATAVPGQGEIEESDMMARMNAVAAQRRDWLFLGPLPSGSSILSVVNQADAEAQMLHIVNTRYLPDEAKYQAKENAAVKIGKESFRWRKVTGSAFDFRKMFASASVTEESLRNVVVYGVTYIESPTTQKKVMRFRSDDGAVVWVNGTQLHKVTQIRGLKDEEEIPMTLRPGRNTILIKVGQGSGGWGMMVHVEDPRS